MVYTFADFFCGIGGFHRGMNGLKCVFACDLDENCTKTYEDNYGIRPVGDVHSLKNDSIPTHMIMCAGFPCQPFSSAGKKRGFDDDRSNTFMRLMEIVESKKPQIILLENVSNLVKLNKGLYFQYILECLQEQNYNVSHSILNTNHFGLAQNRERLYIVCVSVSVYGDKTFDFSALTEKCDFINLRSCIDLSSSTATYIDPDTYVIIEQKYQKRQKSGLIFCGYILGNLRSKGVKENTEYLSRVHKQPNRIYHIDGVHPTLSAGETSGRYYIYDGVGVRKMTMDECYGVMGFHDFKKHPKKSVAFKQIGNSVSPVVVEAIKNELIKQSFIQEDLVM